MESFDIAHSFNPPDDRPKRRSASVELQKFGAWYFQFTSVWKSQVDLRLFDLSEKK